MSSRNVSYRRRRDVRVREVPEMEFCFAYVPANAELYRLNPSAWFVLRMCTGCTEAEITRAYHEAMEPVLSLEQSGHEVRCGLESLMRMRIVERVNATARARKRKKPGVRNAQET